jgi:hypothetical protein
MKTQTQWSRVSGVALYAAASALSSCSGPYPFDTTTETVAPLQREAEELEPEVICAASQEWLPNTPPVDPFMPLPHPAGECPFYRSTWQSFLGATQPDAEGSPAFLSWPTVPDLFESERPRANRSYLGDIRQAGSRQIAIDQNGRSLYYGVHVNQAYADFVSRNGLTTLAAVQAADPNLFFPAGVVELKSAWMDITGEPAADYVDYITTTTTLPTLSTAADGQIIEDREQPRTARVALLGLHVVYTLPGHPEFIWGTFEHTTGSPDVDVLDENRDVAPTWTGDNPGTLSATGVVSERDFKLYKAGTPAEQANLAIAEADLNLDEATQTFPGQQTSVYRLFPGSKSHTTRPDATLSSLNFNVGQLFSVKGASLSPADKRGFYRQIGSVWLDKPQFFTLDVSLQNDLSNSLIAAGGEAARLDLAENGDDSPYSILAGEDRLSNTSMESFTQPANSFPNCFSCHNTQAVTARGASVNRDANSPVLLGPKLINISHVFSQFVREELAE